MRAVVVVAAIAATAGTVAIASAGNVHASHLQAQANLQHVGADFASVVQTSGATQSEVNRLAAAVSHIRLTVDGEQIPDYGIAEAVLSMHKPALLRDNTSLRSALAVVMANLALDRLLYNSGRAAGINGPSPAAIRHEVDEQIATAKIVKPAPFANQAAASAYFHSARYAAMYTHDMVVKDEQSRITHSGSLYSMAQAEAAQKRLAAWAFVQFEHRVTLVGAEGITVHDLAMAV